MGGFVCWRTFSKYDLEDVKIMCFKVLGFLLTKFVYC